VRDEIARILRYGQERMQQQRERNNNLSLHITTNEGLVMVEWGVHLKDDTTNTQHNNGTIIGR